MTVTSPRRPRPSLARRPLTFAMGLASTVVLSACAIDTEPAGPSDRTSPSPPAASAGAVEAAKVTPRIAVSYDGGIQVLDGTTLQPVADLPLAGFNRLNAAGNGRHVLVSTEGGFRVLDAGTWGTSHGDHGHFYTATPALTGLTYAAEEPGHVVPHAGRTALFDDATGQVTVVDSDDIADPDAARRALTTPHAHHGVALELEDGRLVVSEGTEETRTGIRVLSATDEQLAQSRDCPGVHGEATAAKETVVIGCTDGALIYRDGRITKVASPGDYGRIGNQAGSPVSDVVLGDYKIDEDAELERPTRVSLINTKKASLTLIDLPGSYTFRSLGRGPEGEALVLGTDGTLHVIDPTSGKITSAIELMKAWTEPKDWQSPRPALQVNGATAYVTDPASRTITSVDLTDGSVIATSTLAVVPNELAVATGTEGEH